MPLTAMSHLAPIQALDVKSSPHSDDCQSNSSQLVMTSQPLYLLPRVAVHRSCDILCRVLSLRTSLAHCIATRICQHPSLLYRSCLSQCTHVQGLWRTGTYAVLGKRRSRVMREELREGSGLFSILAFMPAQASFGLADDLRRRTSGGASAALMLSHWERLQV